MELDKFLETKGVDGNSDVAAGEVSCEVGGEHSSVGAGNVGIDALVIERGDGFFPAVDVLDFVDEEVLGVVLFDVFVEVAIGFKEIVG